MARLTLRRLSRTTAVRRQVSAGAALAMVFAGGVVASAPTAVAADAPPVADMYPTNVVATPLPGGARVSWDPVTVVGRIDLGGGYGGASIATRYFVTSSYDPTTNSGYRTCVVEVPETSCVITGLVNGASYTFEVKTGTRMVAHNSPTWTGEAPAWSDYSPPSEAVTPCCDAPTAVEGVAATVAGDGVDVAWSPPAVWGGAASLTYTVSSPEGAVLCSTEATSCRIEDVSYGTPESFAVVATNSGGTGPAVRSAAVTVPVQAPQAPIAGQVRYTRSGAAVVRWRPPARDGGSAITGYVVRSSPGGRSCTSSGAPRCTVTGLSSGRAYTFTVRALNSAGTSAASAPIVAGRLVTPASQPRNLAADPSTSSIALTWSRPATTGGGKLLRYVVEDGSQVVCQSRRTSCTVTGLAPGSEHRYRVYAVNTSGQGRAATVTAATTVPRVAPPALPVQPGPPPAAPKPEQQVS